MECEICKKEIKNIARVDGGIIIDIKSKSIKIYFKNFAYNYNDKEDMKVINMKKTDKEKLKSFDFEKNDDNGYKKLIFCEVECYKKFIIL